MEDDIIIGYKKLIPIGHRRWKSPLYDTIWENDALSADRPPDLQTPYGIYARLKPDQELLHFCGCIVTIQAFGTIVLADQGFRCEKAIIIAYDPQERDTYLRFDNASLEHKAAIAIVCALAVYKDSAFLHWATKWLSGDDRTQVAAWAAADAAAEAATWAARVAADAAADAAADTAAWAAARAASWAARVATWAARGADAAMWAEAWAAEAAWAADTRESPLIYAVEAILGHE